MNDCFKDVSSPKNYPSEAISSSYLEGKSEECMGLINSFIAGQDLQQNLNYLLQVCKQHKSIDYTFVLEPDFQDKLSQTIDLVIESKDSSLLANLLSILHDLTAAKHDVLNFLFERQEIQKLIQLLTENCSNLILKFISSLMNTCKESKNMIIECLDLNLIFNQEINAEFPYFLFLQLSTLHSCDTLLEYLPIFQPSPENYKIIMQILWNLIKNTKQLNSEIVRLSIIVLQISINENDFNSAVMYLSSLHKLENKFYVAEISQNFDHEKIFEIYFQADDENLIARIQNYFMLLLQDIMIDQTMNFGITFAELESKLCSSIFIEKMFFILSKSNFRTLKSSVLLLKFLLISLPTFPDLIVQSHIIKNIIEKLSSDDDLNSLIFSIIVLLIRKCTIQKILFIDLSEQYIHDEIVSITDNINEEINEFANFIIDTMRQWEILFTDEYYFR